MTTTTQNAMAGVFDPRLIDIMAKALDEAWALLSSTALDGKAPDAAQARRDLARCILRLAAEGETDPDVLRRAAAGILPAKSIPTG